MSDLEKSTGHGSTGDGDGSTEDATRRFRPEIQGLRGVAIALVVVYHVWIGRVSGGVDAFLFISAYFLTGTFVRRLERGEPARVVEYWTRTFKRLLPPATITVLVTSVLVLVILPERRWMGTLHDAVASLLYVQNWELIRRSTDYQASQGDASVFQHFWSLSIQGQIFVVFPLLFALVGVVARRSGRSVPVVLGATLGVLALASLTWSIVSTTTDQTTAYFSTFTRIWKFALGALLGLLLPIWDARRRSTGSGHGIGWALLGWAGLLILMLTGILLDVRAAFPGWVAIIPLAATAAVIVAGSTGRAWGVDRLLSTRPALLLGEISYSLYLIHWPLLAIWLAVSGRAGAGSGDGLVLILLSLMLAVVLTRGVDTPIRRWRWAAASPRRAAVVALCALLIGAGPALAAQHVIVQRDVRAREHLADAHPGAASLLPPVGDPSSRPVGTGRPLPSSALAADDWYELPGEPCTGSLRPSSPEFSASCTMTDAPPGAPVLVILGSSRSQQLAPALVSIARSEGWQVVALWRSSCPFFPDTSRGAPACSDGNGALVDHLIGLAPEAVMTTTTTITHDGQEIATPGMAALTSTLTATGTQVIAVRDEPRIPFEPADCAEQVEALPARCTMATSEIFADQRPDADLPADAAAPGRVVPVDLTPAICPQGTCVPVIGGVSVFLDRDHVTATYAASLQTEMRLQTDAGGMRW